MKKTIERHVYAYLAVGYWFVGGLTLAAEDPPNVVFFLVDDLGWTDVGCYGSRFYETPNIDRLASEGVLFTDAYAACHVCSPTRASILTGKYPARLKMTDWLPGRRDFAFQQLKNAAILQALPDEEITIAEALRQHGYATGHYGKWHLGEEPRGPRSQGFDVQVPQWNKGWPKRGYHSPFGLDGIDDAAGDYLTDRLTDAALSFIEDHQNGPFFLYLAHFAVHDPIQGRADLVAKYESRRKKSGETSGLPFVLEGDPGSSRQPQSESEIATLLQQPGYSGYRVLPDRMVKIKQHQDNVEFAAMVESMDESLGRVMDALGRLGIAENTLVFFSSDNGGMSAANFGRPDREVAESDLDRAYSTSNRPLRGVKGWLYEGGIRVPLIVKWPTRGRAGSVCKTPVVSTDFYPTILEMIGAPMLPKQHIDGVSFAKLLEGEGNLQRDAIFWYFPHYSNHGMQSPGAAIRWKKWKLIEYFEDNHVQLFDLTADLAEQHDLAEERPVLVEQLREQLAEWREEVAANTMAPNPAYVTPSD